MKTSVLVIGGGPAGASAAIQLARAGAQVTLVERERTPSHKVCGEFLSGEALFYLDQLGIDLASAGALLLTGIRLAGARRVTTSPLPFAAMSLTRRCLDGLLLLRAEDTGVQVHRGCSVEKLARAGGAWTANLADGQSITAHAVFLATGKHDLRGLPRPAGEQRGMLALKMYWRLSAAEMRSLGSAVELITYPKGYAGLQPVEDGMANLCGLIHADEFRRLGGRWTDVLLHLCLQSPHLHGRIRGAEPLLDKPLTVSSIPYGFVREHSEGIWYLGDQAAVIPSFTGDGMSLALHSGMMAAGMYLQDASSGQFQRRFATQVRRQVTIATAVSKAMVRHPETTTWIPRLWPGVVGLLARQTRIQSDLFQQP